MAGLPEFFQTRSTTVLDELADFELGGELEDDGMGGLEENQGESNDLAFSEGDEISADALPDFFKSRNDENSDFSITAGVQADVFFSLDANKKSSEAVLNSLSNLGFSTQTQSSTASVATAVPAPAASASASATSLLSGALGLRIGGGSQPPPGKHQQQSQAPPTPVSYAAAAGGNRQQQQQQPVAASQHPPEHHNAPPPPPPGAFLPPRGHPQFPGPPGPGPYGPPMPFPPPHLLPPHMLPPHMLPPQPHFVPGMGAPRMPVPMPFPPPPPQHMGYGPPPQQNQQYQQRHQQQQYPQQQQQQQQYPQQQYPQGPRLPHGSMMNSSDVRFVVMKSMQSLVTNDPYSDDFYFIQAKYKKNVAQREDAIKSGEPLPAPMIMPFPAWRETKERIVSQVRENKKQYEEKSREWEEKEQVLGHTQRSDVSRPKEQLSILSWQDLEDAAAADGGDGGDAGLFRIPFASRLWNMRQAIQRGYEALYTVQELNHLLQAPMVAGNPAFRGEVMAEIDVAVLVLSQSLGIRPSPEKPFGDRPPEISLEGGLVAAILQTPKGKKLMSRSINLLMPEQRWALIPVILARVLQADSTDQPAEDRAVEQKLLKILLQFIHHSHQYQQDQQALAGPNGNTAPFSLTLLSHLRQCVKSVMVSQMEKSRLRSALLSSRSRAEVMHVVVEIGDKVASGADETASSDWVSLREAFMSMLDG